MNRALFLQLLDNIPPEELGRMISEANDLTNNNIRKDKGLFYPQFENPSRTKTAFASASEQDPGMGSF